jgi:uncharacterized protein YkwD
MSVKKAIIIGSLAVATILPFSVNGQETVNKAKKDLIENLDEKNNKINEKIINLVDYQKQTLIYINEIRKSQNLPPFKYDKQLEKLAIEQSKYLKTKKGENNTLTRQDHVN